MKYRALWFSFFLLTFAFEAVAQVQMTQQDSLREMARQISILAGELEKQKLGEVVERTYESKFGLGPAASQVYYLSKSGPSVAGYGEVVYENYASENEAGSPSGLKDKIDYVRNIIYLGYRFDERFIFNAEIEFEHAKSGDGQPGSVSMEFGYVDAMLTRAFNIRVGMVLVPVGLMNEFHEPATYWSVLRPETESVIIPSTWRSNGIGIHGDFADSFGYRLFLVEGLDAGKFSAKGIPEGRQNGAKAHAEDFGISGRFDYIGINGLNAGISFYSGKSGQALQDPGGSRINAQTSIFALHSLYSVLGFDARFLYARSTIGDADALNKTLGYSGMNSIGDGQHGFYFSLAYDVLRHLGDFQQATLQPFLQYEALNTQKEVPQGFNKNPALDRKNMTVGLYYKPIPNIGFKLDYLNRSNAAKSATDQINCAMVYMF